MDSDTRLNEPSTYAGIGVGLGALKDAITTVLTSVGATPEMANALIVIAIAALGFTAITMRERSGQRQTAVPAWAGVLINEIKLVRLAQKAPALAAEEVRNVPPAA
jgi:hypothetical protein